MNETEKTRHRGIVRPVSVLFIAGILCFLVLSAAATLLLDRADSSYFERRALAPLPDVTRAGVLDGSCFSALDAYLQDHTAGRDTLLRAQTLLDMRLLRRPVVNDTVIRPEVLLPFTEYWTYDRAGLARSAEETAERIAAHARVAEACGGRYYFVAVPHQALAFLDEYPSYLQTHEDYYRDVESLLFPALSARGVEALDMWEVLREAGTLRSVASRVDNHFTVLGAMETYHCLMDRIAADTGGAVQPMGRDDYTVQWLPHHYLGSRARKLFDLWPSGERAGIVVPNDDVPYLRTDRAMWMTDARVGAPVYEYPDAGDGTVPCSYDVYMGGDWASTVIETGRPDMPSVLIYGDSFTNPLECVLWHDFDTLYSFDFRHYTDASLDELIARYQPEIVICVRDYESLMSSAGNGQ